MDINSKKIDHTLKHQSKAYIKPVITKIRLVAEDAVLANCKLGTAISFDTCDAIGHLSCIQAATS